MEQLWRHFIAQIEYAADQAVVNLVERLLVSGRDQFDRRVLKGETQHENFWHNM